FQAEDGIRDDLVTGVQTCALPISLRRQRRWHQRRLFPAQRNLFNVLNQPERFVLIAPEFGRVTPSRNQLATTVLLINDVATQIRSEEHTSELQSPDHLVSRLLLEK